MEINKTIRKKDKGYQVIISYKQNGKWKQKSKQGFKTERAASNYGNDMMREIMDNISSGITETDMTLKEYFDNYYLPHKKIHCKYNTTQTIFSTQSFFFELFEMRIKDIRKRHIQTIVDKKIKNKTYKEGTLTTYLIKLKEIFKTLTEERYISINPCVKIKIKGEEKRNKRALNESEIKELHKKIKEKDNDTRMIFYLCLGAGLRISEALGVTVNDIDFIKSEIKIDKQWMYDNKKWHFGTLKTKNSYRTAYLLPGYAKLIQETFPKIIKKNERLFVNANGYIAKKQLNAFLKQKNITAHELRHTYGTKLVQLEIDIPTAAKMIGDTAQTFISTYVHPNQDSFAEAKNKLQKLSSVF